MTTKTQARRMHRKLIDLSKIEYDAQPITAHPGPFRAWARAQQFVAFDNPSPELARVLRGPNT